MPCSIAQRIDLLRSHEVTTAMTDPSPMPDEVKIFLFSVKSFAKTIVVMDNRNTRNVIFSS